MKSNECTHRDSEDILSLFPSILCDIFRVVFLSSSWPSVLKTSVVQHSLWPLYVFACSIPRRANRSFVRIAIGEIRSVRMKFRNESNTKLTAWAQCNECTRCLVLCCSVVSIKLSALLQSKVATYCAIDYALQLDSKSIAHYSCVTVSQMKYLLASLRLLNVRAMLASPSYLR